MCDTLYNSCYKNPLEFLNVVSANLKNIIASKTVTAYPLVKVLRD